MALACAFLTDAAADAHRAPTRACPDPSHKVHEESFVSLGGIDQWITIRGDRCGNPVVLFLHGGPGNTLSPFAEAIVGNWEKDFTLVQWDQRGAGLTHGRNAAAPGPALSVERMAQDGVELAAHLARHLGQEKVILLGGSWGSILGVHMARSRPDLFHAYVGVSQVVAYRENQPASYGKVLARARAAADARTVEALEALGPPPWKNPRNFGILRRAARAHEARVTEPAPATWWVRAPAYDTPQRRAQYLEGEEESFLQFVGLGGDGMFSKVDLPALGTAFAIPVFIIQGTEDLVTTPEVAKRYFDTLTAPRKEYVAVPRAGHDPNRPLVEAQYRILDTRVRPLVR